MINEVGWRMSHSTSWSRRMLHFYKEIKENGVKNISTETFDDGTRNRENAIRFRADKLQFCQIKM